MNTSQELLIRRHLKLVHSLVKTHNPPDPWRREDLISAGYEALCEAALRWEPGSTSFGTFATYRINGAFLDELRRLRFGKRSKETFDPYYMKESEADGIVGRDEIAHFEIDQLLLKLPQREQVVVRRRMEGFSGAEISKEVGVSISRVSQLSTQAYRQMQAMGEVPVAA